MHADWQFQWQQWVDVSCFCGFGESRRKVVLERKEGPRSATGLRREKKMWNCHVESEKELDQENGVGLKAALKAPLR